MGDSQEDFRKEVRDYLRQICNNRNEEMAIDEFCYSYYEIESFLQECDVTDGQVAVAILPQQVDKKYEFARQVLISLKDHAIEQYKKKSKSSTSWNADGKYNHGHTR